MDMIHMKIADDLDAILRGTFMGSPEGKIHEIQSGVHETAKTSDERWAILKACEAVTHYRSLKRPSAKSREAAILAIHKVRGVSGVRQFFENNSSLRQVKPNE